MNSDGIYERKRVSGDAIKIGATVIDTRSSSAMKAAVYVEGGKIPFIALKNITDAKA